MVEAAEHSFGPFKTLFAQYLPTANTTSLHRFNIHLMFRINRIAFHCLFRSRVASIAHAHLRLIIIIICRLIVFNSTIWLNFHNRLLNEQATTVKWRCVQFRMAGEKVLRKAEKRFSNVLKLFRKNEHQFVQLKIKLNGIVLSVAICCKRIERIKCGMSFFSRIRSCALFTTNANIFDGKCVWSNLFSCHEV